MDTTQIIYASISIGGIGAILGAVLAFSSKVFHVSVDPKVEQISEILPQANCGACGFPGCSGYAEAVASGNAATTLCAPGGSEIIDKISQILGVEVNSSALVPMVAVCSCSGSKDKAKDKFTYSGPKKCASAIFLSGGHKACDYGCLGFGDCVVACQFGAIQIDEKTGLPVVDDEKCTGCNACVNECPKGVMRLIPKGKNVYIACNSKEKGKEVINACSVGCIGCRICSTPKVTPSKAIKMEDNLPVIDFKINDNLQAAKFKCPKGCFIDKNDIGKTAEQLKIEKTDFQAKEAEIAKQEKEKLLAEKAKKTEDKIN